MRDPSSDRRWTKHLVYRAERTRTTWTFRFALLAIAGIAVWLSSGWWTVAIARSLVCNANAATSDAVIVENFDTNYTTFERAAQLVRSGVSGHALVPVPADPLTHEPNPVAARLASTLVELARLDSAVIVPVREAEPFELNTVQDVFDFVNARQMRSVVVVSPLFRSRRSLLVYQAIFGRAGITVTCAPVAEVRNVNTWTHSWHGIQDVIEQWVKLQYYRVYVLPFRLR